MAAPDGIARVLRCHTSLCGGHLGMTGDRAGHHRGVRRRIEAHFHLERGEALRKQLLRFLFDGCGFGGVEQAEHRRALGIPGMDAELLERAIAHGHAAAFRRVS